MALGLPRRWKEIAEYGPVSKCIVVVVPAFCRISEVQPCRSLSQRPRAGVCCQLGGEAGLSVGRGDRRSLTRRRRRLGLPPRRPMLWTGHGPGSPGKTPFAASPPLRRCSGGGRPPRASAPARATPPPANSCHGRRPQPPPATRCCGTASAPLHLDKGQRPHGAGVFSEARVVVVSLSERQSAPTLSSPGSFSHSGRDTGTTPPRTAMAPLPSGLPAASKSSARYLLRNRIKRTRSQNRR
jgi:hypothetical protein